MKEIINTLRKYGLTEHEVKTYLALLELVEASAYSVAERAEIPRTSTYSALENLKRRGFVISSLHNGVKFYTPENPKVFLEDLEEKKKQISEILPALSDLVDTANVLPIIKTYQGRKGYIKVRNEMLETFKRRKTKQILVISSPLDFDLFPKYFPDWISERKKMGVMAKTLLRHDAKVDKNFQKNNQDLREVKYLPAEFQFKGTINIYEDKIALFSLQENKLNSIIIDSPIFFEMLKNIFNFTWGLVE